MNLKRETLEDIYKNLLSPLFVVDETFKRVMIDAMRGTPVLETTQYLGITSKEYQRIKRQAVTKLCTQLFNEIVNWGTKLKIEVQMEENRAIDVSDIEYTEYLNWKFGKIKRPRKLIKKGN